MSRPGTILCALMLMHCALGGEAAARQGAGGARAEEVVRVNAELVQAGVSVFDRQGRFVDGLKKEDFEPRVDGRPVPITFFENVVAGSLRDRPARAAAGNLSARVQVSRDGREVTGTPFRKVATDAQTDPARVPFTAEINLGELPPGRYTLQVTVEDGAARRTASPQTAFYDR